MHYTFLIFSDSEDLLNDVNFLYVLSKKRFHTLVAYFHIIQTNFARSASFK